MLESQSLIGQTISHYLMDGCGLDLFGFATDASSIFRQDNGIPFFRAIASRLVLDSSVWLHKAWASSCRIARSRRSSMGICHFIRSSKARDETPATSDPSRNVSRFGRKLNAGRSVSNPLTDRISFHSL